MPLTPCSRSLPLLTASALALTLGGCAASSEGATGDERPVVLTTFTVLGDIAQNVAGDDLRVESITKVGAEVHGYEPTPGDIRTASEADLIIDNDDPTQPTVHARQDGRLSHVEH